ncbi:MAG: galactose-1-phosphate uridylyltransferase [bacterium]
MPQLRQNPATKEWVIIAIERAKRPEEFQVPEEAEVPETLKTCPFCAGNESLTPDELFAFRTYDTKPGTPGWWIRVVPNKYPALVPAGDIKRMQAENFYRYMDGVGSHEIVIESPEHNKSIATMDQKQVEELFLAYRERFIFLKKDPRFEMILIFKNHGKEAGTSIRHPHSQIVAAPITPNHVRHYVEETMRYFDDNGECVYCSILQKEMGKERIILETDNFAAFIPFAARSPFEIWVMPKKHASAYEHISEIEIKELAFVMRQTLKKLHKALNDPAYNFVILSAPCHEEELEYFHWYIQIVPRVASVAGFEMGSGVYINTVIPEEAAKFLRETKVA